MWVEQGAFNDVDVVETNGFRLQDLVTPYAQNYGVLTFASDHGLYAHIDAYGNGDSGIYPGSGPEGHCKRYGIEIRNVTSHDNVLGYSGTAGNGTWTHNSKFYDNNAGISDDSFASGHPGMPQDCSKWNANQVYSNNRNFFTNDRDTYCKNTPFEKRPKQIVCPQFQVPVGSGFILYGVNSNLIQDNAIYDNWRSGVRLFWVPAAIRGDNDPAHQFDTSNGNQFIGNQLGFSASGKRAPNGVDFFWDEEGKGNCWLGNQAPGGKVTSDPASLPAAPTTGCSCRPTRRRAPPRCRARSGIRRPTRIRPAAPGSRRRRSPPRDEAVAGTRRPAPRRGGRPAAARRSRRRADPGRHRHRAAAVEGEAEPDPRAVDAAGPHPHRPAAQRLAALRRPRHREGADPRRRRAARCARPRCSPSTSRTGSTRGRGT